MRSHRRRNWIGHCPSPTPRLRGIDAFVLPGLLPRDRQPCVYMLASQRNGTLYIGVTSDLIARIHQHREGSVECFSKRYATKLLVWFEAHETMEAAITREKQLKKWNRAWKLRLIEEANPEWRDLAEEHRFEPLSGLAVGRL